MKKYFFLSNVLLFVLLILFFIPINLFVSDSIVASSIAYVIAFVVTPYFVDWIFKRKASNNNSV